ncbi:cupin domain-containing protein [Chitinophaga vietnamensis]|uniref:cupin domain-containing protein n=1 Tax=Chitinophaga vietnamensis TaxID=2593957 RepID=UPI001178C113|nr:cupin domain-containing protein [Chitinophaga vietnamensis]
MKRSHFIKSAIAASSACLLPLVSSAKWITRHITGKGFFVAAGKDRHDKAFSLFEGDTFYTKVSTQDTNGSLYIFESTRDKKGGPPLHFHYEQDEWWYVMEGEFLIKVGEDVFHAKPGDSVFGPRMVPHAFAKINDGNARIMITFQPAGKMEENFRAISEGLTKNMTEQERAAFRKAHGFEVVGPALGYLKQ